MLSIIFKKILHTRTREHSYSLKKIHVLHHRHPTFDYTEQMINATVISVCDIK